MFGTLEVFKNVNQSLKENLIGQNDLIHRLLLGILVEGHILIEGAPGLAKTRAVKILGTLINGDFQRIQFTPDLLPSDITGTDIFRPEDGSFIFEPGPIFHNIILADEINRAPAKVQSALLEAMEEKQVTIGKKTYKIPNIFIVIATQNPIEQEGTYNLPEAQLDRFMFHVKVNYPNTKDEIEIIKLVNIENKKLISNKINKFDNKNSLITKDLQSDIKLLTEKIILESRKNVYSVYISDKLENYIVQIIEASRFPEKYSKELKHLIDWGASPRGSIALSKCTRANAWLDRRNYVIPDDIHQTAHDILRHRIIPSLHAESEGISSDDIIDSILEIIPIP